MRVKSISMALAAMAALQYTALTQSVFAGVTYTPVPGHDTGTINGQLPVTHMDKLGVSQGTVSFQGNNFQIVSDGGSTPQLFGVLMNGQMDTTGKHAKYNAVAFLQGGNALNKMVRSSGDDTVTLKDQQEVTGTIKDIDAQKVTIATAGGTRELDVKTIADIDSPRMANLTLLADASSTVEPGQSFSADSGKVVIGMGCTPNRRKAHRVITRTTTQPAVTTQSYSSHETLPAQTINNNTTPSCTTTEVIQQPAVVQSCPAPVVTQPAVVCESHRNLWPLALLGAAAVATAIAVPIAVSHHHHHHNNAALIQEQELLLGARATP